MVSTLCAQVKKKMRKAEIIVKVVFCFIAHFRTASISVVCARASLRMCTYMQ